MRNRSPQQDPPASPSIWQVPGMTALAVMTFAGFCGYAMLLPVAPMWAVHGGANEAGAGLVNGVLLLFTVLTQLLVPRALGRFGWGPVLAAGLVLLGLPGLAYAVSDALAPVLAFSAVRGIGFGVLTVTGSAAVAQLIEPARRGEAIGTYGLAIALPNLVLLPAGPWVAEQVGFWAIFSVSAMPILGIPAALRLAQVIHGGAQDLTHLDPEASPVTESGSTAYRRLVRPMVLLLAVTLAGGAVITFASQMVSSVWLTTVGLFVMGLVAAAVRWRAGAVADRRGAEPFIWPLVIVTCIGMLLTAYAVRDVQATDVAVFLIAMVVVGSAYGGLQNLTLVVAFNAVSRPHHNRASAVWNVGFDSGTALGSVLVGAIALHWSFAVGMLVTAALSVATLPVALRRARHEPLGGTPA